MPPEKVEALGRIDTSTIYSPSPVEVKPLRLPDAPQKQQYDWKHAGDTERSEGARACCPPSANRGEKGVGDQSTVKLVLEDGVIKEVPKRRGWGGDSACIDWINFSFDESTINEETGKQVLRTVCEDGEYKEIYQDNVIPVTDMQVMLSMSRHLSNIFGFGISSKRAKGMHFYDTSFNVGDNWGVVCHGGQRGTILVSISGSGLAAAKQGWELRLKVFLEHAKRARISRVDLAHDDYTGSTYSVDRANQEHTDGLFHVHGRNPACEHRGDWKNPNGKGRTFNVGNRKNGKFCRVYEKGRQLGDVNSNWVRIEVEFKSIDRVIPFDVLMRPGEYLAASYPAFEWINTNQERIYTIQKTAEATITKVKAWLRHQCGSSIGALVELFGVDDVLKAVVRPGEPKWIKLPHISVAPPSIHEYKETIYPVNFECPAFCS